jgi:uncharacterized membrane protein
LAANAYVLASTTLSGYTSSTFGVPAREAFVSGVATLTGVPASWVTITSFTDASSRRHLLASAVLVAFNVSTYSGSSQSALVSSLAAASTSGALLSSIQTAFTVASLQPPTAVSAIPAASMQTFVAGQVVVTTQSGNGCLAQKTIAACRGSISGLVIGLAAATACTGYMLYRLVFKRKNIEEGQKSVVMLKPM